MIQVFLLLSALATVQAGEGFPPFTWDRVPVSAHLGIDDGMTPDQCKFLADHFNLITFTGGKVSRGGESVEPNIAKAARAIKKLNPNAKVVFYWAAGPKPQWKISNATFPADGYLPVKRAGRMTREFDLSRKDVRDWWTDVAAKAVHEYSCDGIFVDGATAGRSGGPWERLFGKEKNAVLDAGMISMLKDAGKKVGPDKFILFNPLHGYDQGVRSIGQEYLPVTDGAMIDDFDRAANIKQQSKEYMANTLEAMRKAAKDGKLIIFKAWPGFTWHFDPEMMKKPHDELHRVASERITFPLACFLAAAEPNCYFCYSWGWLGSMGTFDWYPEFDKPLGPPKGEAIRKGWTYQREFAHASVFVDLDKKTAKIDWR